MDQRRMHVSLVSSRHGAFEMNLTWSVAAQLLL